MHFQKQTLTWLVGTPGLLGEMFDSLPTVMFYVKDLAGRYVWANKTLIVRSGLEGVDSVVGKTADELFPVSGSSTVSQDTGVMHTGQAIRDVLRLYWTSSGSRFWCLSSKFPLVDESARVVGLAGLSRDLPRPNEKHRSYHRLAKFLDYVDQNLDQSVRIAAAAKHASVSSDTLARLVLDIYHVTPKQFLMKKRIDRACQLLEDSDDPITRISSACGYSDHSAFTRQFRAATHITPAQYRATHKAEKI